MGDSENTEIQKSPEHKNNTARNCQDMNNTNNTVVKNDM